MPSLVVDLLIAAAFVFDWRTRGRPHTVYWMAGAAIVAVQLLRAPLSESAWWHATVDFVAVF